MKNNKLKVANVPNLRFPGFEGEWEMKKLGDCCKSLEYGMNSAATKFDGENKYIRITDIDENSSRYKSDIPVSPEGVLSDKYLVQENDILFARTGASTGKTYIYNSTDGKLYYAGFLIRARVEVSYNAGFIFAQTQTENYSKWVKLMSMRSGQPGINSKEYSSFTFNIPLKLEQDKIANFLKLIDERISTQNKIIEKLKSLMSSINNMLLEEILKFDFFSESWNDYKVFDVLEFFQTNSLSWENLDYYEGAIRNIHYGMIHKHERKSVDLSIDKLPFVKENCVPNNLILCKEGDIIFADASEDTNDVAKAIELINCDDEKIISGLHTIHGRDKLGLTIVGFKGLVFSSKYFRNQIKRLAQGTKVYSISPKNFRECSIKIPPKREQAKIVAIVSSLEKKVSIEINYLSKLEKQKESILKDLFI